MLLATGFAIMALLVASLGIYAVVSYTVAHGRAGDPEWGLVIADVPSGGRAYGRVEDADLLRALEADEWVGRQVALEATDRGVNLVRTL